MAKSLVASGVDTSVITTNRHIEDEKVVTDKWEDVDGIKVQYCKTGPSCYLRVLWHSWREMKDCDTVMLCDMFQRQILPVAFMAKWRKKKIIWSPRGELMGPALAGNRMKRFYLSMVRRNFSQYALFHATSEEEKQAILQQVGTGAKVVVIPNYIEMPTKLERVEVPSLYFLYVGRVTKIKALDKLIIGLAQSKLFKESKYKLIIAGPDQNNYKAELEQMIADNQLEGRVEFIGNVFGKDKFQLYANAYFSCLLSHSENFGNVVIEALSQGTPVIASKGTPWQSLNDEKAGYWIDNSPERIAACMDQALGLSESEYSEIRVNAQKLADSFDVSKNIGNWIEVI
ncbi:MAG: glycosyltransferase [Bacteroidales bacterium]|nr:glycosyltransferase [Bacteroidales bacterium]